MEAETDKCVVLFTLVTLVYPSGVISTFDFIPVNLSPLKSLYDHG